MPATAFVHALAQPQSSAGMPISAQTTTTITANDNSKAKTGTNTSGADSQFNPYGIVAGTVLNHGNIHIITVPDGCTYVDLTHEYTVAGGNPTTLPVVRVFGEVPARPDSEKPWPGDISTSFYNPGDPSDTRDWKALGDLRNGLFAVTLGDLSLPFVQDNGTSRRSEPATVNVTGCRKIIVAIDTAAVGPTSGCIIAHFGR